MTEGRGGKQPSLLRICGELHGRGKSIALAFTADQEAGLYEFAEKFFRTRWAELPQTRRLRGGQAHSRHLTELSSSSHGEIFMSVFGRVRHREYSGPELLHFGCHGRLTNIRRFPD